MPPAKLPPPPHLFAAFVLLRVDAPRDKYGDEFDAVRERTSAVPFQVHCLRGIAQVSIVEGFTWWRSVVAEFVYSSGHRKRFENVRPVSNSPAEWVKRTEPHICHVVFLWQPAPQRFTQQRGLLSALIRRSHMHASSTCPPALPSMFPTGNMGRPPATTERLLEGVCSRAVLYHCW